MVMCCISLLRFYYGDEIIPLLGRIKTIGSLLRVGRIDHVRKLPWFIDHIGFGVVPANHL